jgi:hypothetical protein
VAPHAFLRPIYPQLAADRNFALLATLTQFDRLVEAAEKVSQRHAALMRRYTTDAKIALLGHLRKAESQRPGPREVECWPLRKGERVLSCIAVYLPGGIDIRMLENGELRRTQLTKDGPQAEALADQWRAAAIKLGWIG